MNASMVKTFIATMRFGRPYAGLLALTCMLNLVSVPADLGFLFLFKKIINSGFAADHLPELQWYAFAAAGLLMVRSAVVYASGWLFHYIEVGMSNRVQNLIYAKIHELSDAIQNRFTVGDLMTILFYHSQVMLQMITSTSGSLVTEAVRIPALIIVLFSVHAPLAGLVLLLLVPCLIFFRYFRKMVARNAGQSNRVRSELYTMAEQTLSHLEIISMFAAGEREKERFKKMNEKLRAVSLDTYKFMSLLSPVTQLIKVAGVVVLVILGTHQVASGKLSVGGLTIFIASAYYLYGSISNLGSWYLSMLTGLVSANEIFGFLNSKAAVASPPDGLILSSLERQIELRQVCFRYPDTETPVLNDICLTIAKGETVAIAGPSGCGKSTLLKLLIRLHDPTRGAVLMDGHDLRHLDLTALKTLFGCVPQDPGIFQATPAEAIAYGYPAAGEGRIVEAGVLAGAHDFISRLPEAYRTLIGERGGKMSGGEKQRVALARALIRKADILMMDEALSWVDAPTEKRILRQIAAERKQQRKTTILVSHRLASIRHADRIIVMEQGRVLEQGDHQTLMRIAGNYREWYRLQAPQESGNPDAQDAN
ncbi:MAG: ABC transporter ATP-binding protein [Thermodesulfobacteriota bacterium]